MGEMSSYEKSLKESAWNEADGMNKKKKIVNNGIIIQNKRAKITLHSYTDINCLSVIFLTYNGLASLLVKIEKVSAVSLGYS